MSIFIGYFHIVVSGKKFCRQYWSDDLVIDYFESLNHKLHVDLFPSKHVPIRESDSGYILISVHSTQPIWELKLDVSDDNHESLGCFILQSNYNNTKVLSSPYQCVVPNNNMKTWQFPTEPKDLYIIGAISDHNKLYITSSDKPESGSYHFFDRSPKFIKATEGHKVQITWMKSTVENNCLIPLCYDHNFQIGNNDQIFIKPKSLDSSMTFVVSIRDCFDEVIFHHLPTTDKWRLLRIVYNKPVPFDLDYQDHEIVLKLGEQIIGSSLQPFKNFNRCSDKSILVNLYGATISRDCEPNSNKDEERFTFLENDAVCD